MSASRGKGAAGHRTARGARLLDFSGCLFAVVLCLVLVAACGGKPRSPVAGVPVAKASEAAPHANPAPESRGARQPAAPAVTPSRTLTLTIWGPDFMAPLDGAPGGATLADRIRAFARANPGWQVQYLRKKPYGTGGLIHCLRSTRAAAPKLLPDLVLLDMSELGLATKDSLLQPLEPLLGTDMVSDLMPFAREAGQVGDHLLAYQYAADIRFLAYNSAIIEQPPSTWAELLAAGATYLLPIGDSEGAVRDGFLPQYLAAGGKLADRNGLPYLDRTVAQAVLEVYQSARERELLPAAGFDLQDASDCWPVYLTSRAAMTNVSSWDYNRERAKRLAATRVAPLPTLSGAWSGLSSGWGWAVLCREPRRQAAAAAFLRTVLQAEAMASWSQATYHLPTRRSALALAIDDGDYLSFLERLMDVTVPQPREPVYSEAVSALRPALESVTRGRVSPQAAAAEAADKLRLAREELRNRTQP